MSIPTGERSVDAGHPEPSTSANTTEFQDFLVALRNWSTVMSFAMVQHFDQRSRAGKLSTILMIAEPLIMLLLFYYVRTILRGFVQPYGESTVLFLASGFFPFYLFLRGSVQQRAKQITPRQQLPRIVSLDLFLASSAVNALISLVVMGAVFLCLWLYGISQAKPVSIADCGYALAMLMLLAVGVGLINTAIARFVPFWLTLFGYATRGLLFFSGVIHMPEMLTLGVRQWVSWNPIMHGIEWFRVGLYGRYPALLLDQSYLVRCVVIVLFIGLIADRATLRYAGR